MIFANRVHECLKLKNMKQAELAQETGISKGTISKYLTGQRLPSADKLIFIAETLDVSTDYLLGISDIMQCYRCENCKNKTMCNIKISYPDIKFCSYGGKK